MMKTRYRARGGLVADGLDDFANVVDAGVGGRVHFENVDMAAFHDGLAMDAEFGDVEGRFVCRAGPLIIQSAGQNSRRCGLADAADACQHVGLRDPVHRERVSQRANQDVLADQIVQGLRAVFAGENDVRGGGTFGCGAHASENSVGGTKLHPKTLIQTAHRWQLRCRADRG